MKLIVLKNNLKGVLDAAAKTVGESSNLPVLKHVLIAAEGSRVRVVATNLEAAITKSSAAKVMESGEVVVPYALIASVVGNLQSERINLENRGVNLLLTTENYEATIQGVAPEEFPIIPRVKNETEYIELQGSVLKERLLKVSTAAQISELRPEISGVLISIEAGSLKFVATDSYRLAEATVSPSQFTSLCSRPLRVILPLKTVSEVVRIIPDGSVRVTFDESQVLVSGEDTQIISRLIGGVYPEYERIIPKKFMAEITVEKNELMNALRLGSAFSVKTNEIVVRSEKDGKFIEIGAADSTVGENKYLIPAKISGEGVHIALNWRFLLDGLKSISSPTVTCSIEEDGKKAIVRIPGDTSYFYLVMFNLR